MKATAIKTPKIRVNDDLYTILDECVLPLMEKTVLCVTSKIVSLTEGRIVKKADVSSKSAIIEAEADAYLARAHKGNADYCLTIKNNLLIPAAGIDESNGEGVYILYPQDCFQSAEMIWRYLCARDQLKDFGVILTDSHTTPLRRGGTGIALSWCGIKPLFNYVNQPDVFGAPMRVTMGNTVDSLAATAVLMMGEGNEQTPLALLQDVPRLSFTDRPPTRGEIASTQIPMEEDLYAPLLESVGWIGRGHAK